jgi:CRP/FNR family cyclic AMP-dependent transcriptional regulator
MAGPLTAMRKQKLPFDVRILLDSASVKKQRLEYRRSQSIFLQGDACDAVMYIQTGGVKLSVRSKIGKEAVVAMLGPGDFFGEGCLAGQPRRMGSATAVTLSTVVAVKKKEMLRLLHEEPRLADRFITHMLDTNVRIEEDLVDQLFNHDEKRLARTLLLLARYGRQNAPDPVVPRVSLTKLARMAGTTQTRTKFLMNKFKRLGFVEAGRSLKVHSSLLTVVLHE